MSAYKLNIILQQYSKIQSQLSIANQSDNKQDKVAAQTKIRELQAKQFKTTQGLIKSSIDIIIPAARLDWIPVSDGVVGLAGTLTSFIGIYDTWPGNKAK